MPRPGAPWRLAAALDAGDAPKRWLDLEVARRRALASHAELAHNEPVFRRPISTLDDHLAAGLRVEALRAVLERFESRGEPDEDEAVLDGANLALRTPGPASAVPPGLLCVRAARRHDVGPPWRRDPGGVVPAADLLLQQRVGNSRSRRRRLGSPRVRGARLRAGSRGAGGHARTRPDGGRGRGPDRWLHDPQRLVGTRPAARGDDRAAGAGQGQGLRDIDRAVAGDARRARGPAIRDRLRPRR